MRVHQIITGSCNGDYSHISQAKVRGSNYIVYASGCDIVILNESFCRSQVISGGELGSSVVTAVSFNHWDGKIAVANAKGIYVYVPQATTEGLLTNSSKLLWSFSSRIPLPSKSEVVCLCWSHRPCFEFPNFGLLAGFEDGQLCMWRSNTVSNVVHPTPRFHIGTDLIDLQCETDSGGLVNSTPDTQSEWRVVWRHQMKGTPLQIDFSTDGLYFASIIKCDEPNNNHGIKFNNIMHVWFHDPCFAMNPLKSHNEGEFQMTENWEPIHLPHPCDVYSFSWRRTSRYLPSGWIPNVLLTAGEDNLCRVWVEVTHPPPSYSSLSNTPQLFGSTQMRNDSDIPISSKVKLRIPQGGVIDTEVKYKATCESTKEMNGSHGLPSSLSSCENYITVELPDCFLKHPLLKHFLDLWLTDPLSKIQVDYQGTTPNNNDAGGKLNFPANLSFPQFTFTTSLPLDNFPEISSLHSTTATTTTTTSSNRSHIGRFTTHWFNNKEYRFNTQLELFMMDAISRILAIPVHISCDNASSSSSSSTSLSSLSANNNILSPELSDQIALMDQTVFKLLGELQHAPDVVFAIHPIDGSLIVWYIHGLDMSVPNSKGIRTQKVSIPRETAGRDDAKFNCESAFTLIPNMSGRLTQVTCSVRSRLHQAIPLDAACSISHRLFTYLTTDHLRSKMNQSLHTTTNKNNFSSIHVNKKKDSRNPLMTINYQDNLDIFCHLFLLKYAVNQVFAQFSKFLLKCTTNNSTATKILDQFKQKQLKPILSSLAEIQLNSTMFESRVQHSSHVAMITMHTNGSLRYWRIDVSEHSHYQWIVSISGCSRLSGHRFHTGTIVPHPLLPLALSTSHYASTRTRNAVCKSINFSEIILWHISSVGPLTTGYTSSLLSTNCQSHCLQHSRLNRANTDELTSDLIKSTSLTNTDISGCGNISSHGGISEIARLNFSNISNNPCLAFRHIAWFPCMVTTSATSYPVALFVASLDINTTSRNISSTNAGGDDQLGLFLTFSKFKQVSNNSNSGPMNENSEEHRRLLYSSRNSDTLGCIIQLDYELPYSSSQMKDDQSYTAETLLLHVFPSQLIMMNMDNCKPRTNPLSVVLHTTDNPVGSSEADSDCLESNSSLSTFLIVRMTRYTMNGNDNKINSTIGTTETKEIEFCRMEMWRVRVSTNTRSCSLTTPTTATIGSLLKVVDIDNLTTYNNLITEATKVCDCKLNLPSGVSIICAQVSAAHVSWAALSTFNAPPPYLIVSACSDGCLRFWKCESNTPDYSVSDKVKDKFISLFTWDEWQMPLMQSMSSCIELQLQDNTTTANNNNTSLEMTATPNIIILDMDCAYSGRLAVAYTTQQLYDGGRGITTTATTTNNSNSSSRTIYVTVYECESSGGCEWILEDTIEFTSAFPFQENNNNNSSSNNLDELSIQLDWVNAEDGGHLLSVIIDCEIFVFAPVCQNINFTHTTTTTTTSNNNNHNKNNSKLRGGHLYQPTLMTTLGEVYIGWKPIACSRIMTANYPGTLPSSPSSNDPEQQQLKSYSLDDVTKEKPIPQHRQHHRHSGGHKQAAWLRDGLLLVGARTEMQLFSQWPSDSYFSVFKWQVKVKSDNSHASTVTSSPSSRTESFDTNTSTDITDATVSGSASMSVARLTKVYSAYPLKSSPSKSLLHAGSQSNLTNLTGGGNSTTTTSTKKMSTTVEPNEYHRQLSREMSQIDLSSATTGGIDVKSNEQILKDIELLSNLGLFEAIQVVNPVLPQFHPRQLLEWMNLGHLRRIKAILAHLTRCLSAFGAPSSNRQHHGTSTSSRRMTKGNLNSELTNLAIGSFDTSISGGRTSGKPGTLQSKVATSSSSNLLEAQAIPPLPLYVLLAVDSLQVTDVSADVETSKQFDPLNDWNDEFGSVDESKIFEIQDDDLNLNDEDEEVGADGASLKSHTESKHSLSNSSTQKASQFYGFSVWSLKPAALARSIQFSEDDARVLAEHLSTQQLPGLSPLDQMYLLGIADLMAKTHSDITDCLSVGSSTRRDSKQHASSLPKQASVKDSSTKQGLDECGLRFLLTVQLYSYLSKTLPPARRAQLLSSGLTNSSLVWAYHSDSQEELLSRLPIAATTSTTTTTTAGGVSSIDALELNWPDFKRYGCGWWIRSESLLIRCAEKMARTAFQTTKDPMDAAVFYLAMRKAKMVAALFKTTGNKTLENFFRSDFTPGQPACRQAKLNAFRLLSQHKYLQAAGLFLLAGCLEDAVRVCLDTLKDLQLGVLIVRLYTSSSPGISGHTTVSAYHDFLRQHLIKHEDPFLRSMAFWSLGDPLAALQTLLEGPGILVNPDSSGIPAKRDSIGQSVQQSPQHPRHLSGNNQIPGTGSSSSSTTTPPTKSVCPSVFKFYTYLQSHPLVLRQQRIEAANLIDSGAVYRVKSLERRLYFRTAHHYFVLGCPTLALEVLTKLPPLELVTFSSNMDHIRRMSTGGDTVTTPSSTSRRQSEILSGHVAQSEISAKKESTVKEDDDNLFTLSFDDPIQKYESAKSQDQFTLQWSDDEDADNDDDGHKGKTEGAVDKSTRNNPVLQQQQQQRQQTTSQSLDDFTIEGRGVVDLIANQLKFIACLKILAEELSTLAAGAESEGVSLRQHVWQWLENELAVVNSLTGLSKSSTSSLTGERTTEHNTSVISSDNSECSGPLTSTSFLLTTRNTGSVLAGIFMSLSNVSSEIREAELNRLKTRYDWIKTHETFLTSLINFCDLYGSSGMRLPAVRIELSLLLNELYSSASSCLPTNQSTGLYSAYKSDSNLVAHSGGGGIGGGYSPSPLNSCWPMTAVALIDGIPLLRTVMRLPPGVLLLPDSVKRIKYMVHDLITCLELLPPPFLVSVLLPYPYRPPHAHHCDHHRHKSTTTGKKLKSHTSGKASESSSAGAYYCADCIWAPTADRQRRVYLLRNLCAALSACIHQCLSVGGWLGLGYLLDDNSMMMNNNNNNSSLTKVFALPATSSINARSVDRLCVSGQVFRPNTEPAKWPGLTCLKSYTDPQVQSSTIHPSQMMMRIASSAQNLSDRGESAVLSTPPVVIQSVDRRRLIGLLAQALAASYFGLLVYALYTRDTSILYRLACARLDAKTWSRVFGGTYRAKPYRPPTQPPGSSSSVTFNLKTATTTTDKKGVAPPPPKPPSRPKRPTPISGKRDRSKSRSPEKAVMKARDRAVAALEVASKIGSPPKPTVLTSQHIRFLAHAEAAAIADSKGETYRQDTSASNEQHATTGDQQQQQQQQASVSPDEWFIFAQSSILSCLLERPPKQTDLPADADPNQMMMYDSDASEPSANTTPGGGEYYTYQEALTKHQHCINRVRRFIKQSQRIKQRKRLQHRVKHSLHYRLTGKFTNNSHEDADGAEEEEEEADGECHDLTDKDDSDLDNDDGKDDKGVIPIDKLYLPPKSSLSPPEGKTAQSVSQDGNLNQLLLNLSSDLQPQWILRRLHLNPDFMDTWWGSELECEFYAALNELTTESTEKGQTRTTTAATSLKDFYDYMSSSGGDAGGGDKNPPGNDDFNEDGGADDGVGGVDEDEDDYDDEEDDNLIVDPLGYRKLTVFERERQWAHSDSYAWRLIRLGLMQLAKRELNRLIQIVDFNSEDLAVYAPGLMTLTRQVDCWITGYRLELTSPPAINPVQLKLGLKGFIDEHLIPSAEFLPNIDEDITSTGLQSTTATNTSGISNISSAKNSNELANELAPSQAATRSMLRMKKLLNTKKTPFQTHDPFSLPVKCLWCYLVRQPEVDDMFLRHIFRKPCVVQSTITSQIKFSLPTGSSNILSGMAKSTSSLNLKGITSSTSNIGMAGANTPNPSTTTSTTPGGVLLTDMSKSSGKQTRTQQQQQSQASSGNQTNSTALLLDDAVRLIHKEHDPLIAMCINQVNFNAIAIATPKEIIELDIENLVNLPPWYADEVEYDLESMRRPQTRRYPEGGTDDFIVCDTAGGGVGGGTSTKYGGVDHPSEMTTASNITSSSTSGLSSVGDSSSSGSGSHVFRSMHLHPLHANLANLSKQALERSRRLATTILKRTLPAVYSLASHPTMPYYLSGTGTGSVHMFEWSTPVPVVAGFTNTFSLTAAGASGQFPAGSRGARVTALQFDDSGYRFGCGDAEGNFGLWNLYSTMPGKLPYFRCRCHAKGLADFCFLGCSSLIATVGNGGISTASFTSSGLVESTGSTGIGSGGGGAGGIAHFSSSGSGSSYSSSTGNISLDQDASHLTLWDTLLPVNRCGVIRVLDPELDAPCTSIAYCGAFSQVNRWPHSTSSLYNTAETSTSSSSTKRLYTGDRTVIVGNKNGDVCIVDLRRPKVLHKFSAHESAVRTLCIDPMTDCLMTGGADGIVKIWRLSEQELITSFCGDLNPTRGAAVVAAAALFRGNQSAAIIAATNPGISDIRLLPTVTGASLLLRRQHSSNNTMIATTTTTTSSSNNNPFIKEYDPSMDLTGSTGQNQKHSITAASIACRFLSCGADGGLRMRSLVVRPKPFMVH
ncbi:unnamed protein product [Trichobilharzia szidati]|nr:unnamed protein product [Trichobilharzia szidati]